MDKANLEAEIFLLGGSFDPVHNGREAIVHFLLENYNPLQIWVIPVAKQPLKKKTVVNFTDRCDLLRLVFRELIDEKRLKIEEIENSLPSPSFTWQTYVELRKLYPQQKFRWILGDDVNKTIEYWNELKWLQVNLPIMILQRENIELNKQIQKFTDFMLVENPLWLFSSSQVRKELFVGSKVKERAIQKYMPKRTWEKMKSLVDRQGD